MAGPASLEALNALDQQSASRELLLCCGSTRWAEQMTAARPFASAEAMAAAADAIWGALAPGDWLEAFAAHPRIGERPSAATRESAEWSAREQAGVASAPGDVRERLATRNRDYEAQFGYIFIVCATGKSADEMLRVLERRLANSPDEELPVAGEEQRRITRLRLAKLLDE